MSPERRPLKSITVRKKVYVHSILKWDFRKCELTGLKVNGCLIQCNSKLGKDTGQFDLSDHIIQEVTQDRYGIVQDILWPYVGILCPYTHGKMAKLVTYIFSNGNPFI